MFDAEVDLEDQGMQHHFDDIITCGFEVDFLSPRNENFFEVQSVVPLSGVIRTVNGI